SIENEQQSMKNEMTTVKSDMHTMKDEVTTMKSDIHTMKDEVTTMRSDMLQRFDDIEKKSDIIIEQVVKNAENITFLKNNQQAFKDIYYKQDRTLTLLSKRSIEQEARIENIE